VLARCRMVSIISNAFTRSCPSATPASPPVNKTPPPRAPLETATTIESSYSGDSGGCSATDPVSVRSPYPFRCSASATLRLLSNVSLAYP
jgi:hypothetical protein